MTGLLLSLERTAATAAGFAEVRFLPEARFIRRRKRR
jgi:hypothetical protein